MHLYVHDKKNVMHLHVHDKKNVMHLYVHDCHPLEFAVVYSRT